MTHYISLAHCQDSHRNAPAFGSDCCAPLRAGTVVVQTGGDAGAPGRMTLTTIGGWGSKEDENEDFYRALAVHYQDDPKKVGAACRPSVCLGLHINLAVLEHTHHACLPV
jgi:hypothetical protein